MAVSGKVSASEGNILSRNISFRLRMLLHLEISFPELRIRAKLDKCSGHTKTYVILVLLLLS